MSSTLLEEVPPPRLTPVEGVKEGLQRRWARPGGRAYAVLRWTGATVFAVIVLGVRGQPPGVVEPGVRPLGAELSVVGDLQRHQGHLPDGHLHRRDAHHHGGGDRPGRADRRGDRRLPLRAGPEVAGGAAVGPHRPHRGGAEHRRRACGACSCCRRLFAHHVEPFLKKVPVLEWFFHGPAYGPSMLLAGTVLAVMILPTIVALSRTALAGVAGRGPRGGPGARGHALAGGAHRGRARGPHRDRGGGDPGHGPGPGRDHRRGHGHREQLRPPPLAARTRAPPSGPPSSTTSVRPIPGSTRARSSAWWWCCSPSPPWSTSAASSCCARRSTRRGSGGMSADGASRATADALTDAIGTRRELWCASRPGARWCGAGSSGRIAIGVVRRGGGDLAGAARSPWWPTPPAAASTALSWSFLTHVPTPPGIPGGRHLDRHRGLGDHRRAGRGHRRAGGHHVRAVPRRAAGPARRRRCGSRPTCSPGCRRSPSGSSPTPCSSGRARSSATSRDWRGASPWPCSCCPS